MMPHRFFEATAHDIFGFIISSLFFCIGATLNVINTIPAVPSVVLSYFQLICFIVSIFVGISTLYKHFTEIKKSRKSKK